MLAPPDAFVPRRFENVQSNSSRHEILLSGIQRLRGKLYLEDGAIEGNQLSTDGRHRLSGDEHAWHVVALDQKGEVAGCSRYVAHPNTIGFHRLSVRNAALASSGEWGMAFRAAVARDVEQARRRGVSYVEVGGWALAPELRRSREALRIALATYGLARALGGCIGITTATRRHCSSEILRRIGGSSLQANRTDLPPYYDPQYRCEMEVLRFDSIHANPRFESWVSDLCAYWLTAPVIRRDSSSAAPFALSAMRGALGFEENLALAVQ